MKGKHMLMTFNGDPFQLLEQEWGIIKAFYISSTPM